MDEISTGSSDADQPSPAHAPANTEFRQFCDEWHYRVRAAIVIVVTGCALFAGVSLYSLRTWLWIPPAVIVASAPIVFVFSLRFLHDGAGSVSPTRRRVSASLLYSTTVVAEVLQFVSLPCIVYGVWHWANGGNAERNIAGATLWWLAVYGTMQMAKRVGLSTLTIATFLKQANALERQEPLRSDEKSATDALRAELQTLQARIEQLERRLPAVDGESPN